MKQFKFVKYIIITILVLVTIGIFIWAVKVQGQTENPSAPTENTTDIGFVSQPTGWCERQVYNGYTPMFANPNTGWVNVNSVPAEYVKYNQNSYRYYCEVSVKVGVGGSNYVKWQP